MDIFWNLTAWIKVDTCEDISSSRRGDVKKLRTGICLNCVIYLGLGPLSTRAMLSHVQRFKTSAQLQMGMTFPWFHQYFLQ